MTLGAGFPFELGLVFDFLRGFTFSLFRPAYLCRSCYDVHFY